MRRVTSKDILRGSFEDEGETETEADSDEGRHTMREVLMPTMDNNEYRRRLIA